MVNLTMLCRDRFLLTAQALVSLNRLSNVTILDDRSADNTRDLLEGWCGAMGNKYVRNNEPIGTGRARNMVIEESEKCFGRGDYLYLSDNDVHFHPGWLGQLIQAYRNAWDDGYRIIGGVNHPFHQPVSTFPVTKGSYVLCNVNQVHALATQSMLMTWDVWDEFGPFCETPIDKVCQSEDVDLCNRITKAGYKVGVVSPALIVSTGITNTFGEKIPGWELVKAQAPPGVIVE